MLDQNKTKNFAKVGFTTARSRVNQSTRWGHYQTHNPSAIVRSTCAGMRPQENQCHKILYGLGQKVKGSEWVEVSDELFQELYQKGMGYFYPNHSPIHFIQEFE